MGPDDVPIAGQAKARDLTLVSNNAGEFHRVGDCGLMTGPVKSIGQRFPLFVPFVPSRLS
jgi:hypothetical protein